MSRWLEYCQNWLEIHFFLYFWINMMRFANFGFVCKSLWIKNYQLILMFSSVSLFGLFSASLFTLQYMHAWAKILRLYMGKSTPRLAEDCWKWSWGRRRLRRDIRMWPGVLNSGRRRREDMRAPEESYQRYR